MQFKVVEKLERAGGFKNRNQKIQVWNNKYGENNWKIVYIYKNKIYSRNKALNEFYNKSYYIFLNIHRDILDELCNMANEIYNPHAKNTGGVDLQCSAVLIALDKLNKKLIGTKKMAIGTYGYKNGKQYPDISFKLSPFNVPLWCDNNISIEQFWQEYKYLIIKKDV